MLNVNNYNTTVVRRALSTQHLTDDGSKIRLHVFRLAAIRSERLAVVGSTVRDSISRSKQRSLVWYVHLRTENSNRERSHFDSGAGHLGNGRHLVLVFDGSTLSETATRPSLSTETDAFQVGEKVSACRSAGSDSSLSFISTVTPSGSDCLSELTERGLPPIQLASTVGVVCFRR